MQDRNDEHRKIQEALQLIRSGDGSGSLDRFFTSLDLLEKYECYQPIIEALERKIQAEPLNEAYATRLSKIYAGKVRAVDQAIRILSNLIRKNRWNYPRLAGFIQTDLLTKEDYATEALLLQGIEATFAAQEDSIEALQRICHIYEKKMFNERLLNRFYQRLREKSPGNKKALRFFKLVHSQQHNWLKAQEVLSDMLQWAVHKNEKAMIGLEKAALELYQLGRPEEALATVNEHCRGSLLDTSTVLYDAYSQLGRWEGCLEILRENLPLTTDPFEKSVILFRMGHHLMTLERFAEARLALRESLIQTPTFLDSLDGLIQVALNEQNWDDVVALLEELKAKVETHALRDQIEEALSRLREARTEGGPASSESSHA